MTNARYLAPAMMVGASVLLLLRPAAAFAQNWGKDLDPNVNVELSKLVVEGTTAARFDKNVLHLSRSGGWVRTRRIFSDFVMTAEFLLPTPEATLEVGVRTLNTIQGWPRRGYRLELKASKPATLTARGYVLKTRTAAVVTPAAGQWQRLTISAVGTRIDVTIDGQPAGSYDVEVLAGSILFAAAGRDVDVRQIAFDVVSSETIVRIDVARKLPDFVAPTLEREIKPNYTRNAMASATEGVILYEAVVLADGSVGAVRLTSILHPELEHTGFEAIRQWKFKPARLGGSAVPVLIEIEMSFTLRK